MCHPCLGKRNEIIVKIDGPISNEQDIAQLSCSCIVNELGIYLQQTLRLCFIFLRII